MFALFYSNLCGRKAAEWLISMSIQSKIHNLKRFIKEPDFRMRYLSEHGAYWCIPDEKYLEVRYATEMGAHLNLNAPTTYTEKLQWLKLYDHRPEYAQMVDKYEAKQFVSERIGPEYIIPTYGIWEDARDIDFEILPDKFVLKMTHDSGGLIICQDKQNLDTELVRKKFQKLLKSNYYYGTREWPYKNVKPRILAEKYMEDSTYKELRDYKFFTFGGEPKVLYIAQGRGKREGTVADFFDMEFNHLPFTIDHDMAPTPPDKPKNFELMKKLAEKLSAGTPQLRVDFYEANGRVYFGEMTFFHCSGLVQFHPEEWNEIFGNWVVLPDKRT